MQLRTSQYHFLPRVTNELRSTVRKDTSGIAHTVYNSSSLPKTIWSFEEMSMTSLNSLTSLEFTLRTRYKKIS